MQSSQPAFSGLILEAARNLVSSQVFLNCANQEIVRNCCCGLLMGRSCLMKIDPNKPFVCLTLAKPRRTMTVEPVDCPKGHVKGAGDRTCLRRDN